VFIQSCCVFLKIRQVTRVPPYVRYPFPSKERRNIIERRDLGPPGVPRSQEIGLGSRVSAKACHKAKRRVGV
jgi:hypothetical protein